MIIIEILLWNQSGAAIYMSFNILTCQDEQDFVCHAYPNSVMYPLTEKQATHKASKTILQLHRS